MRSLQAVALTAAGVMLALTIRAGVEANFAHTDTPIEMLIYTQSSPDVRTVMQEVERVAFRTGEGKNLKVAYDDKVSWPFEWYFRDWTGKNFYGSGTPANDAPMVIVGTEGEHEAKVKPGLGDRYIGTKYKLRWWFPEDYKDANDWVKAMGGSLNPTQKATFLDAVRATLQPSGLNRLWRYFIYRETFNPLGSTDFYLYVRKDLVSGLWASAADGTAATPGTVDEDKYAAKTKVLNATQTVGGPGAGDAQFAEPKSIAIGPEFLTEAERERLGAFARTSEVA